MLEVQSNLSLLISVVLFGVKAFALIDCITRSPARIAAAGSLSRNGWLLVLGLAVLVQVTWWEPLNLLNLVGTVAAFVYLAQVRGSTP